MFIQHCYYTKKRCEANHRNLSRDTWQHTWLDTSSAAALCKLCVTICCNIPPRHYSIARPRFEVGKLGINDWKRWFRQHTFAFISVIKYLNLNSGWRKLGALVLPLDSNCESEVLTSRVKSFIFLTSMYNINIHRSFLLHFLNLLKGTVLKIFIVTLAPSQIRQYWFKILTS